MPLYEYRCDKCEAIKDEYQPITLRSEVICDNCKVAMWRVWRPNPIHFKGEGWAGKDK
jgi:putative FmdB family regulatory protein